MLINEKIPITLNKHLAQYYKGLGYDVSNKVIYSWTCDLPRYSSKIVQLKCDLCGNVFKDFYYNYLNRRQNVLSDNLRDKCYTCKKQLSQVVSYGLAEVVKNNMKDWRIDTLNDFNYKCEITGIETNTVHHIYNFRYLLDKTLERLGLTAEDFNCRFNELFSEVKEECLKVHYEYGFGAALSPNIHRLFHAIYSTNKTTPEQYEEFKSIIRLIDIDVTNLTTRKRVQSAKELYIQTLLLKNK